MLLGLTRRKGPFSLLAAPRRTRQDIELTTERMSDNNQRMGPKVKLLDGAWPMRQAVKIQTSRNLLAACIHTGLACGRDAAVAESGDHKPMPTVGRRTLLTRAWPVCWRWREKAGCLEPLGCPTPAFTIELYYSSRP